MELLEYLLDTTLEDDPFVRIDTAKYSNHELQLGVSVLDSYGSERWSQWDIDALNVVDSQLTKPYGSLTLSSGHVLDRQHTDPWVDLYFEGKPNLPGPQVAGNLFLAHNRTALKWIPFHVFLNSGIPLNNLLEGGSGKLATGPKFVLTKYWEVLHEAGIKASFVAERHPKSWDGLDWIHNPTRLSTLIIGEAFVVGESFISNRRAG